MANFNSLCNIAPAIVGNDAELAVRFCFQVCVHVRNFLTLFLTLWVFCKAVKKIDVVRSVKNALFVADLYNNFSRISHYSSLLVDEGVLPLMLHLMDSHSTDEILKRTSETIANLSINRKNRREIASSGIASRLTLLFDKGSSATRASALLIMGNLLSSGLFHDKVANNHTITNILDNLLDINFPKQFNAVSYCLCQLSKNEVSSEVLVSCGIVPITLGYLRQAPHDSVDYLWTVLVNIMQFEHFFPRIVVESKMIVNELYEEVRNNASQVHQQLCVVKIGYNLSKQSSFKDYLDQKLIDLFVKSMKILFSSKLSAAAVQYCALINLINLANFCVDARSLILSADLIDIFYENGIDDDKMNVLYVALLNIISNEESCCYRLLDNGVQKLLVSLQDSFQRLMDGSRIGSKALKKSASRVMSVRNIQDLVANAGENNNKEFAVEGEGGPQTEGELGKELTAAVIHNLALKRPILAPGVLPMMLNLAKNCKTLRVLHCTRALANMSVHSKSKLLISKESRRLIPLLTVIMRCGCEEAEKVQHYCAIVLCNILALSLDKSLLADLVKTGAIVDLMVVTLLRINAITTKETLTKAFFNLLGRIEIRETLVIQLDILAALLELAKLEFVDLLELCMRSIYNITCDLNAGSGYESNYASKLSALKVPNMMVSRLVYSPNLPGSVSNRPIRLLLGMAVANMSFNKSLVLELAQSESKLADAMGRVYALNSDETTYCSVVVLYNLSRYPECRVLAGSKAIPLIVDILTNQERAASVICIKLCIACLCNFSNMAVFHDQVSSHALKAIVDIIGSPQVHLTIKLDAVQTVYNLITAYAASRSGFVQADLVAALWKVIKVSGSKKSSQDANDSVGGSSCRRGDSTESFEEDQEDVSEEYLLTVVSHIMKSLCEDVSDINYLRKMLADGIMNIILKLAKIELNELKIDMSFCLYYLTRGAENMKVLKRDSVDILFWLTLHDTMNIHDLILRNVSRTMRAFAIGAEESVVLVKQDRFFSVLKELIKSKNEDVLWQTAGMIYNIMQVDVCLKKLLERGLIQYIFDLAASGFDNVKHVCSACLHMVPESMPNMEDPIALELVLCLLEAQGDKFSEISERPTDSLPYNLHTCFKDSTLIHSWTNFVATWNPYSCLVDSVFSPAIIFTPRPCAVQASLNPTDPTSIISTEKHRKLKEKDYDEFHRDITSPENMVNNSITRGGSNSNLMNPNMSAPPPPEREPPSHFAQEYQRSRSGTPNTHSANDRVKVNRFPIKSDSIFIGRMSHSSTLPLLNAPVPIPDNTLDAIRKSGTTKSQDFFPSSISYKAAGRKM